ncbi:LytTR family DNA-binding domain-containing protein [Crocinitomicaceae bacterium]|nr:LytTR family DNA-binding domain-containing protein [Crocinitomicaceae bacterium]MDB3906322.1 LytTR family DNA-binding domain-containing protein [Crocinitomicaceae bacterium]
MYHSGESFLRDTNWDFDVAIVDIFLSEEMLGLEVAQIIQEHQRPFIFLTANKDHVTLKKAAMLSPKAYISKPFNENDIAAALEIINADRSESIKVRGPFGAQEIHPNDIIFVNSDGSYIEIQTTKKKFVQRKLLKEIEMELPANFVRSHRSYIVNLNYVDEKRSDEIKANGHSIPVSRGHHRF